MNKLRKQGKAPKLIMLLSALLGLVGAISFLAIYQIRSLGSELTFFSSRLLPLQTISADLAARQLDQIALLRSIATAPTLEHIQQILSHQELHLANLSRVIEDDFLKIETLMHKFEEHSDLDSDKLQKLTASALQAHRQFQSLRLRKLGKEDVTDLTKEALIDDLNRYENALKQQMDLLVSATAELNESSLLHIKQHHRNVLYEMIAAGLATLIFGGMLLRRVLSLQSEAIRFEQLALLGRTAIALQHEINNPLAAIVGNAHLLTLQDLPAAQKEEIAQSIYQMAQRISAVLNRVESIQKIKSTKYVGDAQMLDLDLENS